MAIITLPQDIPSEWWDWAVEVGLVARRNRRVQKKYPHSIDHPFSKHLREVWTAFKSSCECWQIQPIFGGAEPPETGPVNRTWWYERGKELFPGYYNYFMQQTLNSFLAGFAPPWCKTIVTMDTFVLSEQPDRNAGDLNWIDLKLYDYPANYIAWRIWLKMPGVGPRRLWLYVVNTYGQPPPMLEISIHDQSATEFDAKTLTWNNQPALGPLITTWTLPVPFTGWWGFEVGQATRVCIKYTDDGHESRNINHWLVAYSSRNPDTTRRPFYEIFERDKKPWPPPSRPAWWYEPFWKDWW